MASAKELVDRLDLNLLRTLHVLLEEESVTRAAVRLSITQSAVSHALARLREHFDDPLLARTSTGMVATPRAAALRAPLAKLMLEINALARSVPFDPASTERRFRVEAADREQLVLLPRLMSRLAREAPRAGVLVTPPHGPPFLALESGELDLALGIYGADVPPGFSREPLFEVRWSALVRSDHPIAKRGALTLEEYAALSHVLVAPRRGTRGRVDEVLARSGLERRIALVVPSFLSAPRIVAETDLVLTVDDRIARAFAELLPLRVLEPPIELESYELAQLWHESVSSDEGHRWLRGAIAAIAREANEAR